MRASDCSKESMPSSAAGSEGLCEAVRLSTVSLRLGPLERDVLVVDASLGYLRMASGSGRIEGPWRGVPTPCARAIEATMAGSGAATDRGGPAALPLLPLRDDWLPKRLLGIRPMGPPADP